MALKLLSDAIPRVNSKIFARKYIALGRIVTHWSEIIGEDFADKAQPIKIHYRKSKDKSKKAEATLEVATTSAHASTLVYQKDVMLERINQIFGDRWVNDIKFKHVPFEAKAQKSRKRAKTLKPEDKKNLSDMLENIEDPDIKSRLQSMGASLLKDRN
ncbi:MAG: DciA family protein [Pseudomonadota bacterium]